MSNETIGLPQLIRELAVAAQAVVAHWDTPAWKYEQRTGEVIAGLRAAIEKARQAGVTDHIEDVRHMVGTTEQSSAVAVPDGWVLVPVEATTEMVRAMKDRLGVTSRGGILNAGNALNAAIAAAPKQEEK